eukprot:gnl/MRDRNA2_/MRDRNA2_86574_c0_seq1.p1 gnl/MRDRNA2_/MRDRNA2_86574_c0~~gnl/MRDRNA2_/MRDRNA2_86574_c0_seq1.p1  ORF type:complete len:501 (-),score=-17.68 gnl/MRDRNA2_/MRDRNA2_86574_c0_seq1:44-1546(-)
MYNLCIKSQGYLVNTLKSIDVLLKSISEKNKSHKRDYSRVLDLLAERFLTLLPPKRTLLFLEQQIVALRSLPQGVIGNHSLYYLYYEDCIKRRYLLYIQILKQLPTHFISDSKLLKIAHQLLSSKTEQEVLIVDIVLKKLGNKRKIASKAGFLLLCFAIKHPLSCIYMALRVKTLFFNERMDSRREYYIVQFLNQITNVIIKRDSTSTDKLIPLYAGIIEKHFRYDNLYNTKTAKSIQSKSKNHKIRDKILCTLLLGIERVLSSLAPDIIIRSTTPIIQNLFKIVQLYSIDLKMEAIMILHRLIASEKLLSHKFFRALYSILLHESIQCSRFMPKFFILLFQVLSSDNRRLRVLDFIKRMLKVASHSTASFSCQTLLLVSELLQLHPKLRSAVIAENSKEYFKESFMNLIFFSKGFNMHLTKKTINYSTDVSDDIFLWEIHHLANQTNTVVSSLAKNLLFGLHSVYVDNPLRDFFSMAIKLQTKYLEDSVKNTDPSRPLP